MKQLAILVTGIIACLSAPLQSNEHGFDSWSQWVHPAVSKITAQEIAEFKSHLSSETGQFFDTVGPGSQALSVAIYRGLKTANADATMNLYDEAFKIANKAEVGYYMDKVSILLHYPKSKKPSTSSTL